jgi:L-fuculokinase
MNQKIVLVLDCGATNVRTIAISETGKLVASFSLPNNTRPDPKYPDYHIWDVNEIWDKLKTTTKMVLSKIDMTKIAGVTVTAFGVDGAPFKKSGEMLYPVISWQCKRTHPIMANIEKYIPLEELFRINGVQPFNFNTINKLIWLNENEPEVVEKTDYFIFIPSIFLYYLSGEMVNDTSMAGTSMLTDLNTRMYSEIILNAIGISSDKFPFTVEPGSEIGKVTTEASAETGIPANTPVLASGHDTQFAIFGSGAEENIPVLSSGTWEILMVRTRNKQTSPEILRNGVSTELDTIPGLFNIGVQWIASGALEWLRKMFYSDIKENTDIYDIMISEAREIPIGSNGILINPSFYPVPGSGQIGSIENISLNTTRGNIYRAALEALSCKTKEGLEVLEKAGKFKANSLICVGGGSKNNFWNQVRADILDIPVRLIDQQETTVLGAALFAFYGIGLFSSPNEARSVINYQGDTFEPSGNQEVYRELYKDYLGFFHGNRR